MSKKSDERPPTRRVGSSIETVADAGAELASGVAHALGDGLRVAGRQVSGKNATRLGLDNGVVKGVVEGSIRVLEDLPDVLRRSYDILTTPSEVDDEESTGS